MPTSDAEALATFSSTCADVLIPLRTTDTSGWFHSQCSAQAASVRFWRAVSQSSYTDWGALASQPPSRGSMTATASPLEAAYFSPSVPAWCSMSM